MLELRKTDGSLNAHCAECGAKLDKTTEQLRELAASGNFEQIDVMCEKCSCRFKVNLQLGVKEYGA